WVQGLPCRGRHAAARGLTCQPGRRCATRHHLTATARQRGLCGDIEEALGTSGGNPHSLPRCSISCALAEPFAGQQPEDDIVDPLAMEPQAFAEMGFL